MDKSNVSGKDLDIEISKIAVSNTDPELDDIAKAVFGNCTQQPDTCSAQINSKDPDVNTSNSSSCTSSEIPETVKPGKSAANKAENRLTSLSSETINKISDLMTSKHDKSLGVHSVKNAMSIKKSEDTRIQNEFNDYFEHVLSNIIMEYGVKLNLCLIALKKGRHNTIQLVLKSKNNKILKNKWNEVTVLVEQASKFVVNGKKYSFEDYYDHMLRALLTYPSYDDRITVISEQNGLLLNFK